jgi:hypothetical protein
METLYIYCAAIGGGLLVLQVLMLLVSGGESDFDTDASPESGVGDIDASHVLFQLSLKTVVAFITFFGLSGLACISAGLTTSLTMTIAAASGMAAFIMVGYAMQSLMALQSKGNVDLRLATGQSAKVDLRIPAANSGAGKVAVVVGGRLLTKKAVTNGDAIPTGAEVIIQGMTSPDTFEVTPKA